MGEIGTSVNVPSWPVTLDTNSTVEVDTVPGMSIGTIVRASTINDVSAIALRLEEALGWKWIDAAYYSSITVADAAAVAAGKTLMISTAITLPSGAITLSATLEFKRSGSIVKGSATSLTISGPITGNPMHQIFSGFAAGEVILVNGSVYAADPNWFQINSVQGVTDMSLAIQIALYANSKVYLPAGTYYLTSPISIPTNTEFFGAGRIKSTLIFDATFADFTLKCEGTSVSDTKVRGYLHDFGIQGPDAACLALGGIYFDWAYIWTLARIYVRRIRNASAIGFHDRNSFNMFYESCQANLGNSVVGRYGTGFKTSSVTGNVTQVTYLDCLAQYNTTGYKVYMPSGSAADGIIYKQCAGSNTTTIDLEGYAYNISIDNCHIEGSTTGIKGVANVQQLSIKNNYFWNDDTCIDLNGVQAVEIELNKMNGSSGPKVGYSLVNCGNVKYGLNTINSTYYTSNVLTGTQLYYSYKNEQENSLTGNASTPALSKNRDNYVFDNTGATSVGNFSGTAPGQHITLRFNEIHTRIYNSSNILLQEGGVYGNGCLLYLYTPDGVTYYEKGRRCPKEAIPPDNASSIYYGFTHSVGDVRYYSTPAASGYIGWVCTTGGTPGVWKTFGAVAA